MFMRGAEGFSGPLAVPSFIILLSLFIVCIVIQTVL